MLSPNEAEWTTERIPSIKPIDPVEWSAVARGYGLYMSHPWLAAVEEIEGEHTAISYLLIRRRGTLCAVMPLYFRSHPPHDDFYDPVSQFIEPVFPDDGPAARREWYPFVLGGNTAAYWNDLVVRRDLSELDRDLATERLLAAFDRAHAPGAAGLMWLAPVATDTVRRRSGDAVRTILGGAQTTIEVNWPTFEAYTSWLSPSRGSMVRRERNKFAKWDVDHTSPVLADCWDRLAPLVANLQRRYGHQVDESVIRSQLRAHAKHLGDQAVTFACELSGEIVAFSLAYHWENELFVRNVGFDYDLTAGTFAYFNLTYYEPIKFAIENNLSRIHLGLGTYAAKQARGARLTPSWSVVFPPAAASDMTVKALEHLEATSVSRLEAKHGVTFTGRDDD